MPTLSRARDSILPMNTFILVVYLMSLLLKPFLHVSCLVTIMMIPQCYSFDVVFSLFCHSLQFILIVTITCSTDLDDSPDIHTTCLACCVVVRFSSWFSQLVCWSTEHMEIGLEGTPCLWKSCNKSGQDLSVNLSDYVNDVGSILLSTVQTELIENQLNMKILKSVHTVSTKGMFPLLEGNDINLITTVLPVIEGVDIHLKTCVFRKTDHEYPVFAHPALVLKRDFEKKNKKLQDDRFCEFTNREV